jgi:hypothetical protein
MNAGFRVMYVWCPLIKDQIVGDIRGPLLQTLVPEYTPGERYDDWVTEPTNPIEVELRENISQISEIPIRITDSLGRDLSYKTEQELRPTCTLRLSTH